MDFFAYFCEIILQVKLLRSNEDPPTNVLILQRPGFKYAKTQSLESCLTSTLLYDSIGK